MIEEKPMTVGQLIIHLSMHDNDFPVFMDSINFPVRSMFVKGYDKMVFLSGMPLNLPTKEDIKNAEKEAKDSGRVDRTITRF